jgi:hypothetical protein
MRGRREGSTLAPQRPATSRRSSNGSLNGRRLSNSSRGNGSRKQSTSSGDGSPQRSRGSSQLDTSHLEGRHASGEPDVFVDIHKVKVDEIYVDAEQLEAHLALHAKLADFLQVDAGIHVSLGKVEVDIQGADLEAQLKVRLENLYDILDRALSTLDRNPDILKGLVKPVDDTVGQAGQASEPLDAATEHAEGDQRERAEGGGTGSEAQSSATQGSPSRGASRPKRPTKRGQKRGSAGASKGTSRRSSPKTPGSRPKRQTKRGQERGSAGGSKGPSAKKESSRRSPPKTNRSRLYLRGRDRASRRKVGNGDKVNKGGVTGRVANLNHALRNLLGRKKSY